MRIEDEFKFDFSDVLIRPKRSTLSSRKDVILEREFKFRHSDITWTGIPVCASNMDTTGTMEMAQVFANHNMLVFLHKFYTTHKLMEFCRLHGGVLSNNIGMTIGLSDFDMDNVLWVSGGVHATKTPKWLCIDVANGYSEKFVEFVKKARESYGGIIVAGNVVTGEMTEELILAGADIVKVGIGNGSVCTTRIQTGVGYPQLSAIIECADAAHGLNGHIMSDGGCTCPGDVAKAFAGGADFVMSGSLFAGTDESAGDLVQVVDEFGREAETKEYYGMSSSYAMEKHYGGMEEHRSSEGRKISIPYKGPVEGVIRDILGGLRSACTYTGSAKLKELSKRATFVKVHNQYNRSLL